MDKVIAEQENMNTEVQTTFDGGVTEEQIARWKAQHRRVARVDVVDGEELHIGYFKRPNMQTMQAVAKLQKTDELRATETLFDGCWLGGSEYLKTDMVLFVECTRQLNTTFAQAMGSLKNL